MSRHGADDPLISAAWIVIVFSVIGFVLFMVDSCTDHAEWKRKTEQHHQRMEAMKAWGMLWEK